MANTHQLGYTTGGIYCAMKGDAGQVAVDKVKFNTADLGLFVTVVQESQVVDVILDNIILLLPFEILFTNQEKKYMF